MREWWQDEMRKKSKNEEATGKQEKSMEDGNESMSY